MLDKIADELKQQREKSGLSLQQLATKTRIDLKFLEAIDQANFAFLPDLYVKAFVKQYAKTVGLDENLMIKKYEAAKEGKEYDPNKPEIEIKNNESVNGEPSKQEATKITPPVKSYVENIAENKSQEKKHNNPNLIWLIGGTAAVVLTIFIYFLVSNKQDKIVVEETPIEQIVGQTSQRYEEKSSEQTPSDTNTKAVSSDSLYLTFMAKDTSWIYVILDNTRAKEFTLYSNSKFVIAASSNFKAIVGNSGGVTLLLNNQPVEFTGRAGSIKYFKLDKTGLVYLTAPPKLEGQ
jgi:cytoskeletal protein RodZ